MNKIMGKHFDKCSAIYNFFNHYNRLDYVVRNTFACC